MLGFIRLARTVAASLRAAALRRNFAAFYSDFVANQIQGETLPRLSQAGEGFLPEFDFQLKILKNCGRLSRPPCLEKDVSEEEES